MNERDHSSSAHSTRCVIWTPRGEGVHPRLAKSLEQHGLSVMHVEDPFAAMALVCKSHRENIGAGGIVFVPCFPARLRLVTDVIEAISRFAPRAVCWWFDTAGGDQIKAVTPDDIARWSGVTDQPERKPEIVVKARNSSPKLRLAGDPSDTPARVHSAEESSGENILSADELAMLLGEEGVRE